MFSMGRRIAYLRKKDGKSQQLLADHVGVSRSRFAMLERGNSPFPEHVRKLLAVMFRVPAAYLAEAEPDAEVGEALERFFRLLFEDELYGETELLAVLEGEIFCVEQEFLAKILLMTYFLRKREFERAAQLESEYFSVFDPESFVTHPCPTFQKYAAVYFSAFYRWKRDFKKSLWYRQKLVDLVEPCLAARALLDLSLAYKEAGYPVKALLATQKVLEMIDGEAEPLSFVKVAVRLSAIHISLNHLSDALELVAAFEEKALAHSWDEYVGIAYQHRGYILSLERDGLQEAVALYRKSLHLLQEEARVVRVLFCLAECYLRLEEFEASANYLDEMEARPLSTYEKMVVLSMRGQVALYIGEVELHRKYHQRAVAYFEENGLVDNLRYLYGQLGNYYFKMKNYKRASEYFVKKENLK